MLTSWIRRMGLGRKENQDSLSSKECLRFFHTHVIVFISLIPEAVSTITEELWIKRHNINASDLNPNL